MRVSVASLSLLASLPGLQALSAQDTFQGVVTYEITVESRSMTMRHMSKGTKLRQEMEMPGTPGPIVMLVDLDRQVMQVVMESMGAYMEMDLARAAEMAAEAVPGAPPSATMPKVEKLGRSAVIAGVRCEDYRLGEEVEACIATGMGWFVQPDGAARGGRGPFPSAPDLSGFREHFKDGMLPLRVKHLNNGQWRQIMQATSIERKSLDDSLFTLPPGLRKMPMPGGR